ncbi:MAG: hypothetical protein HY819_24550 [Acidobacteria bacterium]|nr:hypothetical protein [Acidobacteriota bacterium]
MQKNLKTYFIILLLALSFLSLPTNTLAQNEDKKNCTNQTIAAVDPTLPVAVTKDEYQEYQQIVAQSCSKTMIEQGLAFIEKAPNSQMCFPLYQNLVTAAIRLNDYDQAFVLGRKALTTYPEHMLVLTQLATIASNQALRGDTKYFIEGEGFARQALDLLKANKMPSGYLDTDWNPYKNNLLADVYQSLGIFALLNGCSLDSARALTSATELNPNQPYTYFLLAKAQVQLYRNGERSPINSFINTTKFASLSEQIVDTYAKACVMTEEEKYIPLRKAIDYDIEMLSKAFPNIKSYLAQSIETIRNEANATLAKPAQ